MATVGVRAGRCRRAAASFGDGIGQQRTGAVPCASVAASDAVDTPVYRRTDLGVGQRVEGPAIVEERETTAVIRPGWVAEVAGDGSLIAERNGGKNA